VSPSYERQPTFARDVSDVTGADRTVGDAVAIEELGEFVHCGQAVPES